MGNKDFFKKLAAGIFFMACVSSVVAVVFVIGLERGFTEPKFPMTALFHHVGGLGTGAPVRLSGVTVGTVSSIDFLEPPVEGRTVRVGMSLFKKFERPLRQSARVAIVTEGVLGEKIIEISVSPGSMREDLSVPVIGEDPIDMENMAVTFAKAAEALQQTSQTVETITVDMRNISWTTKRILNRLEQKIIDGTLFKVF